MNDKTIDLLNAYDGDNVWEDVILGLGGYDEAATNAVCGPEDDRFVADGITYRYLQEGGRWRVEESR